MTGTARSRSRDRHRARLQGELAHLEAAERPRLVAALGATDGRDVADQAERNTRELELAHVDRRIHRLRSRLAALDDAPQPSHGGLAIGTVVVVDVGEGPETYLLGEFPDPSLPTITPDSPLGRALGDLHPGQTVTFRTPRGKATVTLLAVDELGEAV